jgi:hypothetical protein
MKWTEGHVWILETPLQTLEPHFTYKYVIFEDDKIVKFEDGIDRIADLEILPDLSKGTSDFVKQQQKKVEDNIRSIKV